MSHVDQFTVSGGTAGKTRAPGGHRSGSRDRVGPHCHTAGRGIVKLTKIRLEIGGKVGNFSYK